MFTGFVFLSCQLFVLTDIDLAISSTAGPLLEILYQATQNKAGAACLLVFPLVCMLFTTTSLMTTSSRMSYAFARDRGLPLSRIIAKVHPTLDVPVYALVWTTAWVVVFGCILLGSSSAFNAITAASVVALGVTYAIPPAINCLRGRRMLPETRAFKLSCAVGWAMNIVSYIFVPNWLFLAVAKYAELICLTRCFRSVFCGRSLLRSCLCFRPTCRPTPLA